MRSASRGTTRRRSIRVDSGRRRCPAELRVCLRRYPPSRSARFRSGFGVMADGDLRQDILVAFGRLLIWNAAQHALSNQLFQPLCEQMAGDSKRGLKTLEAARAQEAFAEDQKRPTVADHTDGSSHRTWLFFKFIPFHSCSPVVRRLFLSNHSCKRMPLLHFLISSNLETQSHLPCKY